MNKVLIIDDHPLILFALKAMIEQLHPQAQVLAFSRGQQVRELFCSDADTEHDLVLLDLELSDDRGFELLAHLRERNPSLTVVVMSGSERSADVMFALDLGAMGFLPKRLSTEALAQALKLVLAGGVYVPLMRTDSEPLPAHQDINAVVSQPLTDLSALGLTPRQLDVLSLMLQGKQNKEIARRLDLSTETVKNHVSAVLRALGVTSRTQAVLAVAELQKRR